eukprot:gene14761-10557_t
MGTYTLRALKEKKWCRYQQQQTMTTSTMSWVQAVARQSKLLLIITILNVMYLGNTLVEAQSKGGNKRKGNARGGNKKGSTGGSGKKSGAGYSTGMYICLIALLLCFVPAVLVFFYNLYKDPMTPQLIKRLFLSLKDNFTRQLSATNNHHQPPTKRYKSARSTAANNPVDSDFSSVNINMEPSLFDKPKRS